MEVPRQVISAATIDLGGEHGLTDVIVCQAGPEDLDAVRTFVEELSPDSRRARYNCWTHGLPKEDRDFLQPDHPGTSVVAIIGGQICAKADYIPTAEEPDIVEVAIAVGDKWRATRRRLPGEAGLGSLLLRTTLWRVSMDATYKGVQFFSAASNFAIERLLAGVVEPILGRPSVQRDSGDIVRTYIFPDF